MTNPTPSTWREKRCQCGSVQFKYSGDCLACGLTEAQRDLLADLLKKRDEAWRERVEGMRITKDKIGKAPDYWQTPEKIEAYNLALADIISHL